MIALVFCFIGVWGIGFGCGVLYLMHKDEKKIDEKQEIGKILSDFFGQHIEVI